MTSTMENNAHFKDDRQSRLPSLKNGSTMRSSMTSGSTFGVGTSVWNNGANIWRSANRFTDGAAEEDTARSVFTGTSSAEVLTNSNDSKSHSGQSALFALGKAGSMSLLSSSESEAPLRRSNVPWSTSVNTNLGFGSRPQAQPISPLRQLGDESSSSGQRFRKGVAHTPTTIPSTGVDFEQTHQNLSHPGSISQQTLDMSGLGEYLPSFEENQTLLNSNAAAFHSNGVTATNPVSRRFPHSDDGFRNGISYNEMAHIAPDNEYAIFRADREAASSGNHLLSERPPANGFCPSFQNTHNFPQRENHQETFLPFNHDLTSSSFTHKNRGRMGAYPRDEETGFQSHPQSQENWPGSRVAYQRHIARSGFEDVPDESSSSLKSARTPESAQESKHQYFPFHNRTISSGNLGTASPTASEYRHGLQSPPYSTTDTPPRDSESMRSSSNSGISSRTSNGYPSSFERKLRDSGPYQRDHSLLQFRTLQPNVCFSPAYSFSTYTSAMRMNPLANPYTMPGYASLPPASRYFSRESDQSQIVRSPLLEEFRMNNKNNKRYELRDIYNHVVEFSGDQHGSRFIQQRLETANSDEKNQIFTEIQPNSLQLMTDVFGNYVIQKLFEHGNQSQKKVLANQMKGHVLSLSMQMYGCRVVQKALEHVLTDQQASIVKELETHVLKCVKDQNGNHVIQKAIERIPAQHIQFIIYAFTDQVQRLATHPYGCRVIQRMLEHCEESAKRSILAELHACVPSLITDQFGNYVIQHVIENGEAADRRRIVAVVESQLLVYSKHKFASNVVEKSIEFAEEGQRTEILRRLTAQDEKGESPVFGLMRDQYGNYVIQKILAQLKGAEREALINQIKAHLAQLKRFSYGKQIIAIEKLIFDDGNLSTSSQSSAFPSTNASTVEGPITTPYLQDASKPHEPRVTLPHSNPYIQP